MNKNPLVSIVVPIYNVQNYLKKCIDSILEQTYKNFELILIDDGSKDNSPKICKDYAQKDRRVKVFRQQNSGAPTALNLGLSKASGKYVWFIDSDDFIEKNSLKILVQKAEQCNADIILFGARTVDFENGIPNNHQINYWSLAEIDKKYTKQLFSYSENLQWLINLPTVPWNKFHKREFINTHNIRFDVELLAPYDAFFNLCCYLNNAKIIFCDEILYNYRLSNTSTTAKLVSDKSKKWNQPILLTQKTDELIKNKKIDPELYPIFVKRTFVHIFWWFRRTKGSSVKKYYQLMRQYFKNLDKQIYTKDNIEKSENYKAYTEILKTPYWLYWLKNKKIIQIKNTNNKLLVKFCKIEIFKRKKHKQSNKLYLLGIQIYKQKQKPKLNKNILPVSSNNSINSKILLDAITSTNNLQTDKLLKELKNLYREINKLKVYIKASRLHAYLAQYKNKYRGKDIVILATGPSAKNYIPQKNCIFIGINGATRFKNIKLDYLFVQDQAIETQMNEDANSYDCVKFFGHHADIRSKELYPNVKRIPMSTRLDTNANIYLIEDMSWGSFAYDITVEPFGDFHSTVFSALQFALYTNPARIFLVGCDCSNGYFYQSINPFVNSKNVLKGWDLFKKFKDDMYPNTKIISVNPVGLKGMFEDLYTGVEHE